MTKSEARQQLISSAQAIARCGQELKKLPEADYQGGNISLRLSVDFPPVEGGQRVALGHFFFVRRQSVLITKTGCQYWRIDSTYPWDDLVLIQTEPGTSPFYRRINLSDSILAPTRELLAHLCCYQAWQKPGQPMEAVIHYHPTKLVQLTHTLDKLQLKAFYNHQPEVKTHLPEGFGYVGKVYQAGETQLAVETGAQMKQGYRVVIWNQHGPIIIEQNFDQAIKLMKLFA